MICSKCGNEIAVGRVCGKCGNIEGQTTAEPSNASGMRVTAYGAVVPENSGVYVASSLGMAMLAEDTGASEAGELKEREELKDDESVMPETKQSEATSAYAASASEEDTETVVADEVEDVAEATEVEASGTYAEQEETDTEKILEKARAKSAKTFAASSMVSFQEELDLKLEEPVAYVPSKSKRKSKKKSSGILSKVIPLVVLLIVALIGTPFILKYVQQLNCDKQLKEIVNLVNERNTDMEGVVNAILPYFMGEAYSDMMEVCEGNIEYQGTVASASAQFTTFMNAFYDGFESEISKKIGNLEELTYKIKNREELTKEERQALERAYASMSELTTGFQSLYEAMEGASVLSDSELQKLSDIIGGVGDKMANLDISSGYILTIELRAKGEESKGRSADTFDVVVIRADKKWMIDYVSSIVINLEQYSDYGINKIDQFVDYELNVSKLNDQLKRMSEYVATDDLNGLFNQLLNMY